MPTKKTAKTEPKKELPRLYIDYDEYRTGGEPLDDGPWSSREDTNVEVSFRGVYRTRPTHRFFYDSVEVTEDVHQSDWVCLGVVRYDTGDTFGRTNGMWSIVGVTKSPQEAHEMLAQALNGDGYKPWEGHFNSFERTEVHSFKVND